MADPWANYQNQLDKVPGARSDPEVAIAESAERVHSIGRRLPGDGWAMIFGGAVLAVFIVSVLLRLIGVIG